jgi:hypothetical protein
MRWRERSTDLVDCLHHESINKALKVEPNNVYPLVNKRMDLYILHNFTGAIYFLNKTLSVAPHNIRAIYNKSLVVDKIG